MQSGRVHAPVAEALRVYEETRSYNETAKRLNVSKSSVIRYVKKAKIESDAAPEVKPQPKITVPRIPLENTVERIIQTAIREYHEVVFRDRVENLWREDPDRLMREVERLYNGNA